MSKDKRELIGSNRDAAYYTLPCQHSNGERRQKSARIELSITTSESEDEKRILDQFKVRVCQ